MSGNLAYQSDTWDKRREEVIDGKPVMMSPRPSFNHNRVASNIFGLFWDYLRGKKCVPIADGTDLFLDEENRFVPDFMVVCDREKIKGDGVHGAPDLVVEVLSPGTARNDRSKKKNAYQRAGVGEYWIVSPSDRILEIYQNSDGAFGEPEIYTFYEDWMMKQMSSEEKASLVTEFKCCLYDDFVIHLEDIFYDLL